MGPFSQSPVRVLNLRLLGSWDNDQARAVQAHPHSNIQGELGELAALIFVLSFQEKPQVLEASF